MSDIDLREFNRVFNIDYIPYVNQFKIEIANINTKNKSLMDIYCEYNEIIDGIFEKQQPIFLEIEKNERIKINMKYITLFKKQVYDNLSIHDKIISSQCDVFVSASLIEQFEHGFSSTFNITNTVDNYVMLNKLEKNINNILSGSHISKYENAKAQIKKLYHDKWDHTMQSCCFKICCQCLCCFFFIFGIVLITFLCSFLFDGGGIMAFSICSFFLLAISLNIMYYFWLLYVTDVTFGIHKNKFHIMSV